MLVPSTVKKARKEVPGYKLVFYSILRLFYRPFAMALRRRSYSWDSTTHTVGTFGGVDETFNKLTFSKQASATFFLHMRGHYDTVPSLSGMA